MSLTVSKSTDFKINELAIVSKNGKIDISTIFLELSIFDSIYMPVMSGNVLIKDSVGMSSKLLFDGSEVILIDIQKDEEGTIGNLKKAFRVYKQTDRSADGESSETYILNFVSQELIFSDQQRVNQSYTKTYTEMVERIMLDYLLIPQSNLGGVYEPSSGIRQSVIPNLRPIEAIEWVMRKTVNNENSPSYVFFQNLIGYNFASLSSGFNVNVNAPTFGEKGEGDENKNPLLSGKYLITASRHILTVDKHESIIECSSTSSDLDFVQQETEEQSETLKAY